MIIYDTLTVENEKISGFGDINLIVGRPEHIKVLLISIRWYTKQIHIEENVCGFSYHEDYDNIIEEKFKLAKEHQVFLTTQNYEVIESYSRCMPTELFSVPDIKATFCNIGRSVLKRDNNKIVISFL